MEYERSLNKMENKAFEFAFGKYNELENEMGEFLFKHQEKVAVLLYDHGYRDQYVFTALCQNLLDDTNARTEEIFECCDEITMEAVKALSQHRKDPQNVEIIRRNEVASIVRIADILISLDEMIINTPSNSISLLNSMEESYTVLAFHDRFIEDFILRKEKLKIQISLSQVKNLDQMPKPIGFSSDSEYDYLEILIKREMLVDGQVNACDIYINGDRLVDIIAKDEEYYGYEELICGNYIGLPPRSILLPKRTFLDSDSNLYLDSDGRTHTLACGDCGISECATVPVKITIDQNTVVWSDIGLKTGAVGPYTFNRSQYEQALDPGNAAYLSAYCYANGIRVQMDASMLREMFHDALRYGNKQAIDFFEMIQSSEN